MRLKKLQQRLTKLEQQHLTRRLRCLQSPQQPEQQIDGQPCVAFCSNDYLGLANHPALKQAANIGLERYGVGAGSAHLINGHFESHHRLEHELAEWLNVPQTRLFSTGYMANLALLSTLAGRNDSIIFDKLNHASLLDGAQLSGARLLRYPHGDLAAAKKRLQQASGVRVLVTDAVFSMDGDCADLAELGALAQDYDAWLVVDEAHSFGVLGEQGRGLFAAQQQPVSERVIRIGTLGKAFGSAGAFIAASELVTEALLQTARPYMFTTAQPPAIAEATRVALQIIRNQAEHQQRLVCNIQHLKQGLEHLTATHSQWRLLPSSTPIQPLVIGEAANAANLAKLLREQGYLVPAIRPPTVPKGQSRLRFTLSAEHTADQIEQLLTALQQLSHY